MIVIFIPRPTKIVYCRLVRFPPSKNIFAASEAPFITMTSLYSSADFRVFRMQGEDDISRARQFLYEVYWKEQRWDPCVPNPSGLRLVHENVEDTANGSGGFYADDFDDRATWLGVEDASSNRLVGVCRVIVGEDLELSRYVSGTNLYWPLPKDISILAAEVNRIAVLKEYRSNPARRKSKTVLGKLLHRDTPHSLLQRAAIQAAYEAGARTFVAAPNEEYGKRVLKHYGPLGMKLIHVQACYPTGNNESKNDTIAYHSCPVLTLPITFMSAYYPKVNWLGKQAQHVLIPSGFLTSQSRPDATPASTSKQDLEVSTSSTDNPTPALIESSDFLDESESSLFLGGVAPS